MSLADQIFVNMCKDILENGTSTEGEKVRPHWEDGTSAYTIKKFGVVNRYDLSKEFPAITLRKTAIKTCTEEMLWIWQRKSNNINDLNSSVWDEWADETGSIGKAYGYQLGVKHQYKEGMMDQVVDGFEKQLDKLFQDDALDITSDVEVLENMLRQDGLASGGMTMTAGKTTVTADTSAQQAYLDLQKVAEELSNAMEEDDQQGTTLSI